MRTRTGILLGTCLLGGLVGCKDEAKEMSKYPYFIETLDRRWGIARKALQSEPPGLNICFVLVQDLEGFVGSMEYSYQAPNRDEAIARLKAITQAFKADMDKTVDMRSEQVKLLPGVSAKAVGDAIEKAYQEYLKFKPMVAEK